MLNLLSMTCCQVFAEYHVPWDRKTFGLHFHNFTDTLTVFASTSTSDLTIRYPGPNEELTFECATCLCLGVL